MKKRKQILLNDMLFAEFKEKESSLDLNFDTASGDTTSKNSDTISLANTKGGGDPSVPEPHFMMVSASATCPGCVYNFQEQTIGGNGPIKHRPIHEEEEPQRAILGLTPPSLAEPVSMELKLSNGEFNDQVGISTVPQSYDSLRNSIKMTPDVELDGKYFTFYDSLSKIYVTYANTGSAEESVMLRHSSLKTFDEFRFAFLFLLP